MDEPLSIAISIQYIEKYSVRITKTVANESFTYLMNLIHFFHQNIICSTLTFQLSGMLTKVKQSNNNNSRQKQRKYNLKT